MPAIAGTRTWVLGRTRGDLALSVAVLSLLLLAPLASGSGTGPRADLAGPAFRSAPISAPSTLYETAHVGTPAPSALPAVPTNGSPPRWVRETGTAPEPLVDPAYASDPASGVSLLFGGYRNTTPPCSLLTTCPQGSTWSWSSGGWQNITSTADVLGDPPSSWGGSMAYDPVQGEFVEFGGATAEPNGVNNPGLSATYFYSGALGYWSSLHTANVPPARWDAGMVWDPSLGGVVLFGGLTTQGGTLSALHDTWTFNGTDWTNITSSTFPSARSSPAMAWDNQTGTVLLYGGFPTNSETWSLTGAQWSQLTPSVNPGALGGASAATDPVNGTVTLVGGCATDPCTSGPVNRTWTFAHGEWFQLRPLGNVGPEGRDHAALLSIRALGVSFLVGGDVAGRPGNDTWAIYHLEVSEVRSSAAPIDVGRPVTLTVGWAGGTGAATFRWFGLPPGCASSNASSLVCTASAPGPYAESIRAEVSVSPGLTVESPPLGLEFTADPSVLVEALPTRGIIPLQVTFSATVSGGTGSIPLAWNFGDGGVGLGTDPGHTYASAGWFNASVWANDSSGVSARTNVSILAIAPLTVALRTTGSDLTVGGSSLVVATISGGITPYSVATPALPAGCARASDVSWNCSIRVAGTYPVSVVVTDQSNQSARANTTVAVTAPPVPPPARTNSILPSSDLVPAAIVVAALLAALAIGFVVARRRKRRPGPPRAWTSVPVPDPADLPTVGGSLYLPPRPKSPKRRT